MYICMEKYLEKLKEYTQKLHICKERKRYSKTDHDVTFMRMKEETGRMRVHVPKREEAVCLWDKETKKQNRVRE